MDQSLGETYASLACQPSDANIFAAGGLGKGCEVSGENSERGVSENDDGTSPFSTAAAFTCQPLAAVVPCAHHSYFKHRFYFS